MPENTKALGSELDDQLGQDQPEGFAAGIVHACKMLDHYQRRTNCDLFGEGYWDMVRIVKDEGKRAT